MEGLKIWGSMNYRLIGMFIRKVVVIFFFIVYVFVFIVVVVFLYFFSGVSFMLDVIDFKLLIF